MDIIQIGCNDGNDQVFSLIEAQEKEIQKCVLIDANPRALDKAKEKYSRFSFCEFKNLIVLPVDIGDVKVKIFYPAKDPSSVFSSLDKGHVTAHSHSADLMAHETATVSLSALLKEYPQTDFLFIDTEGLDALNLLSVDFNQTKLKQIVFEFIHSDGLLRTGARLTCLTSYLKFFNFSIEKDPNSDYNMVAKRQ